MAALLKALGVRVNIPAMSINLPTAAKVAGVKVARSMSTAAGSAPVVDTSSQEWANEVARRDALDHVLTLVYSFNAPDAAKNVYSDLYRYEAASSLAKTQKIGTVGGYATPIKSDSAAVVHDGVQAPGPMVVRHHIPVSSLTHLAPAKANWGAGPGYEIFTHCFPEFGKGGWPQMIVGSNVNPNVTPPTPMGK